MSQQEINEKFIRKKLALKTWESFLLSGWDRVGHLFYRRRYDQFHFQIKEATVCFTAQLMPLRYRLKDVVFSKSQRKNLRKNADLRCIYQKTILTDEKIDLFNRWYVDRFQMQGQLSSWLPTQTTPFRTHELMVYDKDKLVACSYFDVTPQLQYSTIGFFDPELSHRSLGTFTLLKEIEHGIRKGKLYHYPGHAYWEPSMYDYKKYFSGIEHFHWDTETWQDFPRLIP